MQNKGFRLPSGMQISIEGSLNPLLSETVAGMFSQECVIACMPSVPICIL